MKNLPKNEYDEKVVEFFEQFGDEFLTKLAATNINHVKTLCTAVTLDIQFLKEKDDKLRTNRRNLDRSSLLQ